MGETSEDINLKNKRDTMYEKYSIPFWVHINFYIRMTH